METKRTREYSNFALGVRSPEKNNTLFRSKFHVPISQSKIVIQGNSTQGGFNSQESKHQQNNTWRTARAGSVKHQMNMTHSTMGDRSTHLPPANMTRIG